MGGNVILNSRNLLWEGDLTPRLATRGVAWNGRCSVIGLPRPIPMKTLLRSSVLAAALVLAPLTSSAAALLGGYVVVATDGNVVAKFLDGAGAAYSNDLYLDVSGVGIIFNNHSSSVGDTVD